MRTPQQSNIPFRQSKQQCSDNPWPAFFWLPFARNHLHVYSHVLREDRRVDVQVYRYRADSPQPTAKLSRPRGHERSYSHTAPSFRHRRLTFHEREKQSEQYETVVQATRRTLCKYPCGRRGNNSRSLARIATTSLLQAVAREARHCVPELLLRGDKTLATTPAWVHTGSLQLANTTGDIQTLHSAGKPRKEIKETTAWRSSARLSRP